MISVDQALSILQQHHPALGTEEVDLLGSLGRILAQPIVADRDFPPYHRVTMDGIALQAKAAENNQSFPVEKVQAAGKPIESLKHPDHCIEVMTGAVLPENTDVVIPYEQCEITGEIATLSVSNKQGGQSRSFSPYQNVHLQGSDAKAGTILMEKNKRITAAMAGLMASVGYARLKVYKRPSVAICTTGDEVVGIDQQPAPYQIRPSNAYMLMAALQTEGIQAKLLHLRDDPKEMRKTIAPLLENVDVIIFSGAVSKGKFDYLPNLLEEMGAERHFHGVAQKPGKPLLFASYKRKTYLFGFPGNPVSCFVCYHLFFRPWLCRLQGLPAKRYSAQLQKEIVFHPALTYHVLVHIAQQKGLLTAIPYPISGSGDLPALARADAILSLPAERNIFNPGETHEITML